MKRYDSYKDSGVKWLGEIPSHWEVKRLRAALSERKERFNSAESLMILSLIKDKGIIPYDEKGEVGNKSKDDHTQYKVARKGDLVINSMNVIIGSLGITPYDGYISPAYYAFKPNNNIFLSYYNYILSLRKVQQSIRCFSKGIMEIRLKISAYDFLSMPFPFPTIKEQEAIANFLDSATSKIDEVIAQQQKMIDLLNERKQIIINNAVTKGLDPNVPMKDSGVDWIGQIPEHWEVRKLGSIGSTINGVSHDSTYFGEGYPFVSYSDVYKNISLPKTVLGLAKSSNQERLLFSVEKGDVFFTRTSETAEEIGFSSTCLETIDNAVFAGFLIRFRPIKGYLDPFFSKYYFRAHIHRSYFVKEMNLVIRASLSQQLLKGLPILLPPIEEQRSIAIFLDKKIEKIDLCICNYNKRISLLQERKQIIINDVVTGKVKVNTNYTLI